MASGGALCRIQVKRQCWLQTDRRTASVRHCLKPLPLGGVRLNLWRPLLPYEYGYLKHPMPDQFKLSFVIFDIRALWRSWISVRVPGCQKLQMTA